MFFNTVTKMRILENLIKIFEVQSFCSSDLGFIALTEDQQVLTSGLGVNENLVAAELENTQVTMFLIFFVKFDLLQFKLN